MKRNNQNERIKLVFSRRPTYGYRNVDERRRKQEQRALINDGLWLVFWFVLVIVWYVAASTQ